MSKTERFIILDAQNAATIGDTANKAATLHPQNVVRRKLADISNLPQNQRLLIQEEKSKSIVMTSKEYIDQLQMENVALVNMLAQRNKIIEQSGIELDRLRVNLLKMQEQNQVLAQSNTQMLAELNSGKDRLKLLQHELGCKSGLLKARKLELEGARMKLCKNADAELIKSQVEGESLKEDIDDEKQKPHKSKRNLESNGLGSSEQDQSKDKPTNKRPFSRRQSARFKPAEIKPTEDLLETNSTEASVSQLPDDKEQIVNKRPFVRRQSARFKAAEVKHAEHLTETNDTKISESQFHDDTVQEQGSTSESRVVKEESEIVYSAPKYEPQEFGRSSLRPSRVAAKKVQSYKEVPLNVKMRRSE